MPERLKGGAANPVRDLRLRLWAEMLDLPEQLAAPLLADPVAATALFDRSPLLGNRYTDVARLPRARHVRRQRRRRHRLDGPAASLVGVPLLAVDHVKLFDGVVDPTSALEIPDGHARSACSTCSGTSPPAWPATQLRDHIGQDVGAAAEPRDVAGRAQQQPRADRTSAPARRRPRRRSRPSCARPATSATRRLAAELHLDAGRAAQRPAVHEPHRLDPALRVAVRRAASTCCWRACRSRSGCRPGSSMPPATSAPARTRRRSARSPPGSLDALKVVYNQDAPTSIFVHVRVHATGRRRVRDRQRRPDLLRALPLLGDARHGGARLPPRSPRPGIAPDGIEWLRHPVTPWWPAGSGPYDGLFAFRSLDLDTNAEPLKGAAERLRRMNRRQPTRRRRAVPAADSGTELVLADTVVPWWSPWVSRSRGTSRSAFAAACSIPPTRTRSTTSPRRRSTSSCRRDPRVQLHRRVVLLPLAAAGPDRHRPRPDVLGSGRVRAGTRATRRR